MVKTDDVFMDLDLNKDYTPPEETKDSINVVPEVKTDVPDTKEQVKEDVPEVKTDVPVAVEDKTPPAVAPDTTDETKGDVKEQVKEDVPEVVVDDGWDGWDDIDEEEVKTVEDLLAEIENSEEDVKDATKDVKDAAEKTWDEDLKAKVDELLNKIDEKDRLIERQKWSLETLTWEHSKTVKDNDLNSVRINELESLMAPLENNNDLKALVAYSTKGDDGKEKRVEVLKRLLAQDGVDIDAIESERTRQEKTALGWEGWSWMGTNFEIGDNKQEVFTDL